MDDITVVVGGRRSGKTTYLKNLYDENSVVIVANRQMAVHNWAGFTNVITYKDLKGVILYNRTVLIDDYDAMGYYNDVVEKFWRYNRVVVALTPTIVYIDTPPTWYDYYRTKNVVKLEPAQSIQASSFEQLNNQQYITQILGEIIVKRKK